MSRKSNPMVIGSFVLAGLLLGFGLLAFLLTDRLFRDTEEYVMYFEGNVDGLDRGSPVLYKGFRVGRVTDMRLVVNRETGEATLPVFVALEPDRLEYENGAARRRPGAAFHIERGLRAQLQRKSLITGQMVIMLVEAPDSEVVLHHSGNGVPEIPTIPTLTQDLADTLQRLPLEQMVHDLHTTLTAVRDLMDEGGVKDSLKSLDRTLDRTDALLGKLEDPLPELVSDVSRTSKQLSVTLRKIQALSEEATPAAVELRERLPDVLDGWERAVGSLETTRKELVKTLEAVRSSVEPGTPTHRTAVQALEQVRESAESVERLTDYLQRHPEALLKGKPQTPRAP